MKLILDKLQNSQDICGGNEECAYQNEYANSINEIEVYDDNNYADKLNYLNECYNYDDMVQTPGKVN